MALPDRYVERFPGIFTLAVLAAIAAAWILMVSACVTRYRITHRSTDLLFEGFQDPPAAARPFVRWWWNGNRVTEREILRELDVLAAAGIGGVEINPIAMPPGSVETGDEALTWLEPGWNRVFAVAVEGAKERGMTADLIVGTGWPFGGRFLAPEDQIKNVHVTSKPLSGPGRFEAAVAELLEGPAERRGWVREAGKRLQFLRLMPANMETFQEGIDLEDRVREDGTLEFDIPGGEHVLYIGTHLTGFREVTHGAPGAEGPVLDHYCREAVDKYLARMSGALVPVLGGRMGDGLRALFCDSIELSGANWTDDLPGEFERRRGYAIDPYLPFVLTGEKIAGDSPFADTVRRARYDYARTLVELFHERFIHPFHQWCRRSGTLSRYQAYGSPWLMGMLEGYLVPDIPEGDTWLFYDGRGIGPDLDGIRYAVWNKYASSGAHLAGRPIVSCESMTNTRGVFKATLDYIKQADDLNFLSGVNHTVLHGFNYSPPEAGFPGWVRYGTYFSERNPWWPHLRYWADYNARLSWVFQSSRPVCRVAILGPAADVWSEVRLSRAEFIATPWYLHHLWQALSSNGLSADYVDASVVAEASFEEDRMRLGQAVYDLLISADMRSIEPEAASALARYASAGGKIAFIGRAPDRSPGLEDAPARDAMVREHMEAALGQDPDRVAIIDPPEEGDLLSWTGGLIDRFDMKRDVEISPPDDRLFQIRRRMGTRDIFFLANLHRETSLDFTALFDARGKIPWRWDPESGERWVAPHEDKTFELSLGLEPLESMLIVFEPQATGPSRAKAVLDASDPLAIEGPWQLVLTPIEGEPFEYALESLADFAGDPKLMDFAGIAEYRAEFTAEDSERTALTLGRVAGSAEVFLNGRPLGVAWYGRPVFHAEEALREGSNELRIRVATAPYNYCRTLNDNPTAMRWVPRQRGNRETEPESAGLLGPVRLMRVR